MLAISGAEESKLSQLKPICRRNYNRVQGMLHLPLTPFNPFTDLDARHVANKLQRVVIKLRNRHLFN